MNRLKVLKFGGTSLQTKFDREMIKHIISKEVQKGNKIIIVVSAIGRLGDPYSTDTLLRQIKRGKVSSREVALISSCGEVISSVSLSSYLNNNGFRTVALTGREAGIITSDNFTDSEIIDIKRTNVDCLMDDDYIPIIAGFQGCTERGNTTILGRGGSDVTAAAMSSIFKADELVIYTDVPGIMTSDPKLVNDPLTLRRVSYDLALTIANNGGKVIHPHAISWVKKHNITMKIKSLKSDGETVINHNKKYRSRPNQVICITSKGSKITIIGDELKESKDIHGYIISYNMDIRSLSYYQDKMELIVPEKDVIKCVKIFHDNLVHF